METQVGRKPPLPLSQPSIFYYRENILQLMYWSKLIPVCRHLPALVYEPLLEGSYDPLLSFTSLTWKGATTPWLKATTLSTSMDHVSLIFTLDPKLPLEHNLQVTFHHIFRLDPLHTFKLKLNNSDNPDHKNLSSTNSSRTNQTFYTSDFSKP